MSDRYTEAFGRGELNQQVDPDELLDAIGLDEEEIAWRKEFIGFDDADAERLSRLGPLFEDHADQIAEDFYQNLTDKEETVEVIGRSPKSVDQLKRTQSAYFATLTDGEYGHDYFRDRARIGKLHDLLEMPMKHYIGQYGVYYDLILRLLGERLENRLVESLRSQLTAEATDGGRVVEPGDRESEAMPSEADDDHAGGDSTGTTGQTGVDMEAVEDVVSAEVEDGIAEILSVLRIVNLDMQVVADTYIHSYNERLTDEVERRERIQRQVRSDLEQPVEQLQETSDDVAESANAISTRTAEQRERIEEISGEISNMGATIEEIASTASEVEATSQRAQSLAEDGRDEADEAVSVMDEVGDEIETVESDVERLQDRIGDIDEVVTVINEIADETNMLALNASIEAARAGESGQGFAVVADEVKNLAEESKSQAEQIEQLVDAVQQDADDTVESLAETTDRVTRGVDRVEAAMGNLEDIAEAVTEAAGGIDEVSTATDDQAASTEEIASMLDQLVEHAETVSEEVEDVATASREQAMMVDEISNSVTKLTGSESAAD